MKKLEAGNKEEGVTADKGGRGQGLREVGCGDSPMSVVSNLSHQEYRLGTCFTKVICELCLHAGFTLWQCHVPPLINLSCRALECSRKFGICFH